MKCRGVRKCVIYLLGGAIVNAAVTWSLAMHGNNPNAWLGSQFGCDDELENAYMWRFWIRAETGRTFVRSYWTDWGCGGGIAVSGECRQPQELLPNWALIADARRTEIVGATHRIETTAYGWPMRCAWNATEQLVWCEWPRTRADGWTDYGLRATIVPVNRWFNLPPSIVLPTHPIWPGLIINSALYAAALWFCIAGPLMVRRRIRRSHSRCVYCGYPRGASEVCTECGKKLG